MKVRITLVEEMLGTACANHDVHKEFIASKSKDAKKIEEEQEALPAETLMDKAVTVFPRGQNGLPILFDYQVKGFFKDAIELLTEIAAQERRVGKTKLSKWTVKRVVDNYLFVFPRKIELSQPLGEICTRPLRAQTRQGERVALASSETVPAGTWFDIEVRVLTPELEGLVRDSLDYGAMKGIGQWRNSGKGRFSWTVVE